MTVQMAGPSSVPRGNARSSQTDFRPRPTFLYIGAPKAGSTWIWHALNDHPDIFVPAAKDLLFFNYRHDRGLDWYLRQFRNANRAKAIGEVAHEYYLDAAAARRIQMYLPDVRLICCLREPGDFAISLLRWWQNHTRSYGSTFEEMANHRFFVSALSYRKNLEVYFDLFPRKQILIMFFEQLVANPRQFIREIYEFVGVDPRYQPKALAVKRNATRLPRSRILSHCAVASGRFLGWLGAANFVGAVRQSSLFNKVMYGAADHSEDPSTEMKLRQIAKQVRCRTACDAEALAQLIGKPLPPEWLAAASR